jgi:hypothetical protein
MNQHCGMKKHWIYLIWFVFLTGWNLAAAEPVDGVRVVIGPTPIPAGTAQGEHDITLINSKMAVAFAVNTIPPWGVPRGGIIDIAEVRNGVISPDRAALLDFLPNSWSQWTHAQPTTQVLENTPDRVTVETGRDWLGVRITTTFTLETGQNLLHLRAAMHNTGTTSHTELLSGYVLWTDSGYLFGIPGLPGMQEGSSEGALANWSAAYDQDWVMGLHAGYADHLGQEARDRYLKHDLEPGETVQFEAWMQMDGNGSLTSLVASDIRFAGLESGRISGSVHTSNGEPVEQSAVVISKWIDAQPPLEAQPREPPQALPYAWAKAADGQFGFALPVGRYSLYATAKAHSDSTPVIVDVKADEEIQLDFTDLGLPASLDIFVREKQSTSAGSSPGRATGAQRSLDARLSIESGPIPLIRYFGDSTFFTGLDPAGWTRLILASGTYRFKITAAEGFTSQAIMLDVSLAAGEKKTVKAEIPVLAHPADRNWFGGDMHHHSDVLDGFTEPEYVMRSELAAGVDVTLLSDHDSVINNHRMKQLAAARGIPFIAGTELSPSWAHFNAYPLDEQAEIGIDVGSSTVQMIFAEARRMGADVVQLNHPYIAYGYFHTDEQGAVPGGYSDAFDLVEITAADLVTNSRTVARTWGLWNEGQRAYFSAGSDAHDVWTEVSGSARMYVKVDGKLTVDRFIAALKRGNAYASTGPLVYPEILFGETIQQAAGETLSLNYELQAVNGLRSVTLVEGGVHIQQRDFDGNTALTAVQFQVTPEKDTWYSLVAEDVQGKFLLSNPIWVRMAEPGSKPENTTEARD